MGSAFVKSLSGAFAPALPKGEPLAGRAGCASPYGTQIEVIDGRLTGKFKSNNCYGEEKVHRICEALTTTAANAYGTPSLSFDRSQYEIEAFGDSRGDKEMLAYADKGHYKPFRI